MNHRFNLAEKRKQVVVGLFLISAISAVADAAAAPRLYFESRVVGSGTENWAEVILMLDTAAPVNGFDLSFSYPKEQWRLEKINSSRSLIDVWQGPARPVDSGIVEIRGGSTEPFSGSRGVIAVLTFVPAPAGETSPARFDFTKSDLFLADGRGSKVSAETAPLLLAPRKIIESESSPAPKTKDLIPPLISLAKIISNPLAEDGQRLFIFEVRDAESGLADAWVRTKDWFFWSEWQVVTNPASLSSGVWAVELRVADNDGNESRTLVFRPAVWVCRFAVIAAILGVFIYLWRRRLKSGVKYR